MASAQLGSVLRHIHQIVGATEGQERSDAQLLLCFREQHDESAFRLLMERHGRMVLGVCRRILRQQQDAEDAFQATFLVLARNAAAIRKGQALTSWLYGVAYRTALKARRQRVRRQAHERRASSMTPSGPDLNLAWQELQAVLAEEVGRLAEKYRAPFVLCCLEGLSKSEAARRLDWKEGTVSGRLAEARKRLQQRLARRGLTLAAALCAGAWTADASAAIPPLLLRTTLRAAVGLSVVPPPVAALMEGASHATSLGKAKLAGLLLVMTGFLATGIGSQIHRAAATPALADKPPAAKAKSEKPPAARGETRTVRGRVLDPEGHPVPGARVFLPAAVWGNAEKGDRFLAEVKGAADGSFGLTIRPADLRTGRYLVAAAKEYGIDWKEADKLGSDDVTFRLVKELPITGRVLDLEGRPVRGISLHVAAIETSPDGDLGPVLKSIQRDGNRVFKHPLRGVYMAKDTGIIPQVQTDEQGRFRITGAGGERVVRLWLEGPDIEHQMLYVLTRPGVNVKELVKSAPDRSGLRTSLPRIYGPSFEHLAGPTRPITGVVRDRATGKPVADVAINGSVRPHVWWENYVRGKTDKDGRFRLIGLPKAGSYHVSAWALPQDYIQTGKDVGDRAGLEPLTVDFELTRGVRVRGRITDKVTGKPVPAAIWYVPLKDNRHFAALPGKDAGLFAGLGHRNEKDGSYSLLALPGPGIIRVRAEVENNPYTEAVLEDADRPRADCSNPGMGDCFIGVGGIYLSLLGHNAYRIIDPAAEGRTLTCDFHFNRGRSRSGTVVDPDGKPLKGVRVSGLNPNQSLETLGGNSFTAIALTPARPRLLAFGHKERKLIGHVLLPAEGKEPLTVRLQPGSALTGRLLGEHGKPLAGVTVHPSYLVNESRWLSDDVFAARSIQTDADGRFRIEGVFPGLEFGLALRKGSKYLQIEEKYRKLKLDGKTKDLGDIVAKPF